MIQGKFGVEDWIISQQAAANFHQTLLNHITVAKEYLGLAYQDIMNMPLKDFYELLKIKSLQEKRKAEMIKEQQDKSMKTINARNMGKNERTPGNFFKMIQNANLNSQT